MPNQYSSEKRTVGQLLSMTSPPIAVPDFQRNFTWKTSEVETFWQDLIAFSEKYPGDNMEDQEYFLGSIVMVNRGSAHLLLDGQQRLATSTILLSVIRDSIRPFREDAAARTSHRFIADIDDATGTQTFKLTLNRYDRDFFRREVQEWPATEGNAPEPELSSHGLIRKAREFFERVFQRKYEDLGQGTDAFEWALWIQNVLTNHVSVVAVASMDEDNAADVFETLNDRGVGLSTPDLLRNLLLRRADDPRREEVIECWGDVLEVAEDAKVEDFLRHYWLSREGDVKTRGLYREIKGKVQELGIDSVTLSRELQQASNVYRDIASARDSDPDLQRLLESVDMLGAKSLMPPILSAYAVTTDNDDKRRFIKALITLFVRHNVIGNLESTRLETAVYGIAKQVRGDGDFAAAVELARNAAPSDDEFIDRFKVAQVSRRASARYVLREIEHAKRSTQELEVAEPARVHLEHIYPLTPQEGQRWGNHNVAIDRLGNQTLLDFRLNTAIKNNPFEEKKPEYEKSELLITRELLQYDHWDMDTVNARQTEMAGIALSIWSFPQ